MSKKDDVRGQNHYTRLARASVSKNADNSHEGTTGERFAQAVFLRNKRTTFKPELQTDNNVSVGLCYERDDTIVTTA